MEQLIQTTPTDRHGKFKASPPGWLYVVWIVAMLIPPAAIAYGIQTCGVNVPVQDEFEVGKFLLRVQGYAFPPWSELFAQHNEARIVFTRLLIFGITRLVGWDVKWEMWT